MLLLQMMIPMGMVLRILLSIRLVEIRPTQIAEIDKPTHGNHELMIQMRDVRVYLF